MCSVRFECLLYLITSFVSAEEFNVCGEVSVSLSVVCNNDGCPLGGED